MDHAFGNLSFTSQSGFGSRLWRPRGSSPEWPGSDPGPAPWRMTLRLGLRLPDSLPHQQGQDAFRGPEPQGPDPYPLWLREVGAGSPEVLLGVGTLQVSIRSSIWAHSDLH